MDLQARGVDHRPRPHLVWRNQLWEMESVFFFLSTSPSPRVRGCEGSEVGLGSFVRSFVRSNTPIRLPIRTGWSEDLFARINLPVLEILWIDR